MVREDGLDGDIYRNCCWGKMDWSLLARERVGAKMSETKEEIHCFLYKPFLKLEIEHTRLKIEYYVTFARFCYCNCTIKIAVGLIVLLLVWMTSKGWYQSYKSESTFLLPYLYNPRNHGRSLLRSLPCLHSFWGLSCLLSDHCLDCGFFFSSCLSRIFSQTITKGY